MYASPGTAQEAGKGYNYLNNVRPVMELTLYFVSWTKLNALADPPRAFIFKRLHELECMNSAGAPDAAAS